jgi:hypothetical protein
MKNNLKPLSKQQVDSAKKHMSDLTSAIYETARWMLLHNKNDKP